MPDILQELTIKAPAERVFDAISGARELDRWWTKTCSGQPVMGATYQLGFGPGYQWRAAVTRCERPVAFELTLQEAHPDWAGTIVGFQLAPAASGTAVRFSHLGWPADNDHYRVSCHCWALYLRLLRRYIEHQEFVPYEKRLDA